MNDVSTREEKIAVVAKWLHLVDEGDVEKLVKAVDELYHEDFMG